MKSTFILIRWKLSAFATAAAVALVPGLGMSEGKAKKDWAEDAAQQYERKSEAAIQSGNEHDALIYLRMAQIKRDAGQASKDGKPFDWDEYHQLQGMLKVQDGHVGKKEVGVKDRQAHGKEKPGGRKEKPDARKEKPDAHKEKPDARKGKPDARRKDGERKPEWRGKPQDQPKPGRPEKIGSKDPGAGFIRQAEDYEQKGMAALKAGDVQKAVIYVELAGIKRQAAVAAKNGQDFDWSHYHKRVKDLKK